MKKKSQKNTIVFKLKGGYKPIKLSNIHQHFEEVKRGAGVVKPDKGKGSYSRQKFKKDLEKFNKDNY